MTEVLAMLGRILRGEVRAGLMHTIWSAVVLVLLVQQFWSKWFLAGRTEWSLSDLSLFLLPSFLLYLAASLLSPSKIKLANLDAFLLERRRAFFIVLAILMVSYSLEDRILVGGSPSRDAMRALGILIYLALAITKKRRVHFIGAIVVASVTLYFALTVTATLGGMITP
jgi:hypothetical protein